MSSNSKISFPQRTGHDSVDIFNAVVTLVRNRTGQDFHAAYNRCLAANPDLMTGSYGNLDGAQKLTRLLNRFQANTGLPAVQSTELAADRVGLLTNRFLPALAQAPTARQWDILRRAAEMLEKEGVPVRLMNRASGKDNGVSAAESREEDVFNLLDSEAAAPAVDLGKKFEGKPAGSVCRAFRSMVELLMDEQNLSRQQAFDHLKETQPVFWTMAMLSFDEKQA